MKRLILALVCSLAFFSATANAQAPKDAAQRTEALRVVDVWLDSVQAYQHIPAISAGVVVGDDLVWSKGYGTIDASHTVAATPQTIYSICSISKLFTSIALMQLYEQGKVRLDDPITTYLPWATIAPAADSGPITLRGMLSHSAGLPRESDFPYWSGPDFPFPTREAIRAKIAEQSALYPAERYFQYSNLGLTLVGETVAAVSGQPYAEYAKANVLVPIGLNDTRTFMPMDLYGKRLAVGFGALKRDGTRDVRKAVRYPRHHAGGRLHLHGGRPWQVRLVAISSSAHRPDEDSQGSHPARDATRAIHGSGLEDQLGTWFRGRAPR